MPPHRKKRKLHPTLSAWNTAAEQLGYFNKGNFQLLPQKGTPEYHIWKTKATEILASQSSPQLPPEPERIVVATTPQFSFFDTVLDIFSPEPEIPPEPERIVVATTKSNDNAFLLPPSPQRVTVSTAKSLDRTILQGQQQQRKRRRNPKPDTKKTVAPIRVPQRKKQEIESRIRPCKAFNNKPRVCKRNNCYYEEPSGNCLVKPQE